MTTQPYESIEELEEQLLAGGVILTPTAPDDVVDQVTLGDDNFDVRSTRYNPNNPDERRGENLVTLYNTITGEPIKVDTNQALVYLRKHFPNVESARRDGIVGRRAFTLGRKNAETGLLESPVEYKLGEFMCMLNDNSPDREFIEAVGLTSGCPYSHGPTYFAMLQHMQKKHANEYAAIERARVEEDRREEREQTLEISRQNQELLRLALAGNIAQARVPAPEAPVVAVPVVEESPVEEDNIPDDSGLVMEEPVVAEVQKKGTRKPRTPKY